MPIASAPSPLLDSRHGQLHDDEPCPLVDGHHETSDGVVWAASSDLRWLLASLLTPAFRMAILSSR